MTDKEFSKVEAGSSRASRRLQVRRRHRRGAGLTQTMLRALVKRSTVLDYRGHRVELAES